MAKVINGEIALKVRYNLMPKWQKVYFVLTLINAAFFYYYLTRGGAQSSAPSNRPKNRGLGVKHGRTLKYRQL